MKVYEVIERLQDFPMDMVVECIHEETNWDFNGEYSFEYIKYVDGPVERVERWTNKNGEPVVRIS